MLITVKEKKQSRQGNDAMLCEVWGMALQAKDLAGSRVLRQENLVCWRMKQEGGTRTRSAISWEDF